jgi:hypothetical protein
LSATVVFERSDHRRYMGRPFTVWMDGSSVAMLRRGRSVDVEVNPGAHDASVEMDGYASSQVIFTVREGETARFRCEPNPDARFVSPWWSLLSRRLQARYERLDDPSGRGAVLLQRVDATGP